MSHVYSEAGPLARAHLLSERVFAATVRHVRRGHSNGIAALLSNILQTLIFLGAFVLLYAFVPGMGAHAVRGDFVLFLITGIFLFMTHVKTVGAVAAADGPGSPMMTHAPMTTAVGLLAAALSALYLQTFSVLIVLVGVHVAWHPVVIADPVGTALMLGLAWLTGVGVGTILLAAKPWAPQATQVATQLYSRVNMILSGQMFLANALPGSVIVWFGWNPLFHAIDQARGYAFVNYSPHHTGWPYPAAAAIALLVLGMMAELYTRRRASLSWFAAR